MSRRDEVTAAFREAKAAAREATPPPPPPPVRRGLVLGAGGVLGAAWTIGALSALEEVTGWDARTAEVIVGTSAGSVLAAFLGSGVSVQSLLNHQRGVVAPGDPVIDYDYNGSGALPPLPRLRLGSTSLLLRTARHPTRITPMAAMTSVLPQGRGSLRPLRQIIESVNGDRSWTAHPATWIVAMDYDSGERVPFGRPDAPPAKLTDAVMASCAIPGWYTPVRIGGRRYVDGGACSPTSLDLLAPLGLDEVVVLSPMTSFDYDRPRQVTALLERRFRRLVTRRLSKEMAKVRATGTRVIALGPGPDDLRGIGANLMDPRRRTAVLDTSLRTSREALERHYEALAAAG